MEISLRRSIVCLDHVLRLMDFRVTKIPPCCSCQRSASRSNPDASYIFLVRCWRFHSGRPSSLSSHGPFRPSISNTPKQRQLRLQISLHNRINILRSAMWPSRFLWNRSFPRLDCRPLSLTHILLIAWLMVRMMAPSCWIFNRKFCLQSLRPSRRPRNFRHLSRTRRRRGVSRIATPATGGGRHDICAESLDADGMEVGIQVAQARAVRKVFRNLCLPDLQAHICLMNSAAPAGLP